MCVCVCERERERRKYILSNLFDFLSAFVVNTALFFKNYIV